MKIWIFMCALILILSSQIALSATALSGPDLVISTVDAPASVNPGVSFIVTVIVANQGNVASSSSYVKIYLSPDKSITTADTYLKQNSVTYLTPGTSVTRQTTVTIPAGISAGTYYLGAIADGTNTVAESNEGNNARASSAQLTIAASSPSPPSPPPPPPYAADLVVSSITGPMNAAPGAAITVNCTVSNQGNGASGSSYVKIYLSPDKSIIPADTYLKQCSVSYLAPGTSVTRQTTVTIPAGISAGTYYLGAIADGTNTVAESNEGNNARASSAQLTIAASSPSPPPPPPYAADLVVSSVTGPLNAAPGAAIAVDCTISNKGTANAGAAYAYIYISGDPGITTSDQYLGNWYISSLTPGVSTIGHTTVTIPAGTATGTYYLGVIADVQNYITESNETNNAGFARITISALPPPPPSSIVQEKIAFYTNQERIKAGKNPLTYDSALAVVAQDHSNDMALNHFFSHTSPNYGTFATRLVAHQYTFWSAGENIAMNSAYDPSSNSDTIAKGFVGMWMASEGHRENILNSNYNRIGVGVAYGQACYATQDFAQK